MEYGLSFGTNLGDRVSLLKDARKRILALPGTALEACSRIYETEPVDVEEQYLEVAFLNAVIIVSTCTPPLDISRALHQIETDMGRVRTADKNAPRPIDIDIIYAGTLRMDTPELVLPHRRWAERRFVVQPLADVRPDLMIANITRTVQDILESLPPHPKASLTNDVW